MRTIYSKRIGTIMTVVVLLFSGLILLLSLRGKLSNPTPAMLNSQSWEENGPFELSPERGRFALLYSIAENHSVFFTTAIARFATPDLGYINGKYVSLFAPAISYIALPGYFIGKFFGASQVGTYAVVSLFAIINVLLIIAITRRLGANLIASLIAAMIFLFATPAYVYAVSLFQHHISVFLILLSLYLLLRWDTMWSLAAIWFLCAASIPVDYPNLFLMLPIGIAALCKIIYIKREEKTFRINISYARMLTLATILLPLAFFLWFNQASYGNPLQLSGTVPSVKAIDESGQPIQPPPVVDMQAQSGQSVFGNKNALSFFETRNLLNGLYEHVFSADRGIITFTPVILFGIFGFIALYRKKPQYASIIIAITALDVLIYSMWGDPYGGWAFGSRYLIPAYAMLAIGIAIALTAWRKNLIIIILFVIFAVNGVWINTLGALTSSSNPPLIEVLTLEKFSGHEEKYSYDRNWQDLTTKGSKSFIYQTVAAPWLSPTSYFWLINDGISAAIILLSLILALTNKKNDRIA